ncbi:hypothetical protein [Cellvibrio sp. OA-2007]|uniref:hypothetical protein n=1 Tax=Cellvibrio sp. OA-2007 TaxID=529823 RepID=UPI0007803481|nr:hypothetical protein [Cellvibrio sp. OA-2007]
MIKRLFLSGCSSMVVMSCLMSFSLATQADGLADFRSALARLKSSAPIAVNAQFKLFGRSGERDELIEREGLIEMRLEDGANGLHAVYSPALTAQLHAEELAKIEDENVKNSALNAVGQFQYWEWRELLYPAAQMELMLGRYHFVSETPVIFNGQPTRLLTFSMPMEKIDKEFRQYVKKYKNRFQVWIDDNGIPLASQLTEKGSGRVFIVIGFQFKNEIHSEYRQQGSRLITVKRELRDESSGATMQSQRHFVARLNPVAAPLAGTSQ